MVKPFGKVKIGDIGFNYAENKVRIIAKGKLENLIQYDSTGACDDWLEEDPEYATTADCVAVEMVDYDSVGRKSKDTYVYPYGEDGVTVEKSKTMIRQFSFDFVDEGNIDNDDLKSRVIDALETAGIEVVGAGFPDNAEWTMKEYGLKEDIIGKGKYGIEVKDLRGIWVPASENYPQRGEPAEFKNEKAATDSNLWKRLVDRYGANKVRTYRQD